jgi:hypothetical protein
LEFHFSFESQVALRGGLAFLFWKTGIAWLQDASFIRASGYDAVLGSSAHPISAIKHSGSGMGSSCSIRKSPQGDSWDVFLTFNGYATQSLTKIEDAIPN